MVYKKYFTKTLEENIINLYAKKGEQWLANLPQRIEQLKIAYNLSDLKPFENLSYNEVLSGFQGTRPVVLKLGFDNESLKREALALKAFAGFGTISLLAECDGMLLLERAMPGISLTSYFHEKENEAIRITCDCLNSLHKTPIPVGHPVPDIRDWLRGLDNDVDIPNHLLSKARKLRDELISTAAKPVLLHGDLHHDNILKNGDGWRVIDPKGALGEPAYDIAAFIRNPMPALLQHQQALDIINNRIIQFAKILNLSAQRISDWCYVQAVLAWVWTLEDRGDETYFKKLTELFVGR